MKNITLFILFLLLTYSCSNDHLLDSSDGFNSEVTGKIPYIDTWDEETKFFFDLNNASEILDEELTVFGRTNDAPLVLTKVMKKLVKDDHVPLLVETFLAEVEGSVKYS